MVDEIGTFSAANSVRSFFIGLFSAGVRAGVQARGRGRVYAGARVYKRSTTKSRDSRNLYTIFTFGLRAIHL